MSANDPMESFLNSVQLMNNAFSPLELGIRKAAKDLESCWGVCRSNRGSYIELNSKSGSHSKVQICSNKKKERSEERENPIKSMLGFLSSKQENGCVKNSRNNGAVKRLKEKRAEDGSCTKCVQFDVAWSLLVNGFVQAFPILKTSKKGLKSNVSKEPKPGESKIQHVRNPKNAFGNHKEAKNVSFECFIGFIVDQFVHSLQKLDWNSQQTGNLSSDYDCSPSVSSPQFDFFKAIKSVYEGHKVGVNGFLWNLKFARVGGVPSGVVGVSPPVNDESDDGGNAEEFGDSFPQKLASGLLSIPLSNEGRSSSDHPDKKKLISVQDFFRYTESEGRRFFEELDRDGDGQVTLEDLEIAMKKRKLPLRYARELLQCTRSHLFSKSFGWKQFLSFMEQKEPTILRAYTSLCLSTSGTLKKSEILASLKDAGLPANEDNAVAMMRFLNADTEESISYGHFRNFMLLLPSDRLQDDPRSVWFEAATVVAVPPPVEMPAGSVLKSALAGGLSCAFSCALMHPIDTVKTRVQASTLSFPEIISKLPEIGLRGVYLGSIPAILGQFSSHGLRTGICEVSKVVLINVAPTLPNIQVQSIASFFSTVLGTAMRVPCEVLKQRLQAGLYENVGEAIIGTWHHDGLQGFFRGTGATLCREVPFYVAGMCLYEESKKVAQKLLRRELEPWETVVVGAVSGGLASMTTTPFDVMKTRMMTTQGVSLPMSMVFMSILREEGPVGLFRGVVPRFFWIAPLGAINFAGYELARKALDKF